MKLHFGKVEYGKHVLACQGVTMAVGEDGKGFGFDNRLPAGVDV